MKSEEATQNALAALAALVKQLPTKSARPTTPPTNGALPTPTTLKTSQSPNQSQPTTTNSPETNGIHIRGRAGEFEIRGRAKIEIRGRDSKVESREKTAAPTGQLATPNLLLEPLPPWQIRFSTRTGKPYYKNTITYQTAWRLPESLSMTGEAVAANPAVAPDSDGNIDQQKIQTPQQPWIVRYSKRSGKPYYRNTSTGEALWQLPDNILPAAALWRSYNSTAPNFGSAVAAEESEDSMAQVRHLLEQASAELVLQAQNSVEGESKETDGMLVDDRVNDSADEARLGEHTDERLEVVHAETAQPTTVPDPSLNVAQSNGDDQPAHAAASPSDNVDQQSAAQPTTPPKSDATFDSPSATESAAILKQLLQQALASSPPAQETPTRQSIISTKLATFHKLQDSITLQHRHLRNVENRFQEHTRTLELYQKRIKEQKQVVSALRESFEDLKNRAKETQTQMVQNEARVAELEDTIASATQTVNEDSTEVRGIKIDMEQKREELVKLVEELKRLGEKVNVTLPGSPKASCPPPKTERKDSSKRSPDRSTRKPSPKPRIICPTFSRTSECSTSKCTLGHRCRYHKCINCLDDHPSLDCPDVATRYADNKVRIPDAPIPLGTRVPVALRGLDRSTDRYVPPPRSPSPTPAKRQREWDKSKRPRSESADERPVRPHPWRGRSVGRSQSRARAKSRIRSPSRPRGRSVRPVVDETRKRMRPDFYPPPENNRENKRMKFGSDISDGTRGQPFSPPRFRQADPRQHRPEDMRASVPNDGRPHSKHSSWMTRSLFKTALCYRYQNEGVCYHGDYCEFAHGKVGIHKHVYPVVVAQKVDIFTTNAGGAT
ncbi:hypothetical protein HDV00_010912 [Rhizophlyctis rosea]|nr:hypothetical protein HDV00_010912 [Rhizophlyctis rosea]